MVQVSSLAEKIIAKTERLKTKRMNFENLWQQVSELVLPRKADFTVYQTQGTQRSRKLFETTAVNAAELLAAGLFGMMTNPMGKWFSLSVKEGKIKPENQKKIDHWLDQVQDIIRDEINRPWSGFATNMHEVYLDLAVLGTAGLYVGWNEEKNCLLFQSRFLGELFIDENPAGQVDCVHRVFRWSVDKMVQTWGIDALPETLQFQYNQNPENQAEFEIIHAIFPNNAYKKSSVVQKPINSIYVLKDYSWVLFESGFEEMPLFITRWAKASAEVYGRSPALSALPDIKMIQEMMKETIISAQLANRPPLMVKDDDQFAPLTTVPGGILRYTSEPPRPFVSGSNANVGLEIMNEIRQRIRMAFFNDQLTSLSNVQMTATEVLQRNEEKMRLLGPVSGRLQTELLGPMIDRVFGLLRRKGKIPDPPYFDEQKIDISVEYLSPLALAQKQIEAQSILKTLEFAQGFFNIDPEAGLIFNVPETIRHISKIYATNQKILRSDQEVNDIKLNRSAHGV